MPQDLHAAANHQRGEAARLGAGEPLPGGAGADGARPQRGASVGVHLPAAPPRPARGGKPGEHRLCPGLGAGVSPLPCHAQPHHAAAPSLHQAPRPARGGDPVEHGLRQAPALPARHAAVEEGRHGALCGARSVSLLILMEPHPENHSKLTSRMEIFLSFFLSLFSNLLFTRPLLPPVET